VKVSAVALLLPLLGAAGALQAESPFASLGARTTLPTAAVAAADEVVVGFRADAVPAEMERALRVAGGRSSRRSASGARVLLTLDAGFGADEALARLRAMPEVAYAERNVLYHASQSRTGFFTPNDRFYEAQWNLEQIGIERTWGIQKGAADVVVAVVDTGVAYEDFGRFHKAPDWGGTRFVPGYDFVNGDSHPNDDEFHGTHIASTIAEATDNQVGVAGIAFGCAIMPVKVLDANGDGTSFAVADGIDFAVTHGAKIVNLSLGGPSDSAAVRQAVDRAVAAGVTVVAAAGNSGIEGVEYPAALPNVIAVGAVDQRKAQAPYSNFGAALDVMAPGGDGDRDDNADGLPDSIFQQMPDPDAVEFGRFDVFGYFGLDGTSSATAHVSALAALLYSQGITEPASIQAAIERSAEDLGPAGRDDRFGHGLIRPSVALSGLGLAR
jgi:serine protease